MRRGTAARFGAVLLAGALIVAACGDDDDDDPGAEGGGGNGGGGEEALVIGRVLPETGPLAFLGPPMITGTDLAIEDINAAGGVLGQDVELRKGDEGETPAATREAATRLLDGGASAIIGPAASGSVQEIIQQLSDQNVVQCSGSATSPALSEQENADFFFRTVPPDEAVAPVIADTVIGDGASKVVVAARADDYGNALGELVKTALTEAGATVPDLVSYDPDADNFNTETDTIVAEQPDAVVLIAFDEGGDVAAGLLEKGITADQLYGSDGVFGPTFPDLVEEGNANIVDGMKVIGASGGEDFNERIAEPTENNFIYGGQTYDCVIVVALAAEAAGSTDGEAINEAIVEVTKGGEKCTTFEECKGLLDDDQDIDYDGASGPLELDDNGNPTQGRYSVGEFVDGELVIQDSQDVDV